MLHLNINPRNAETVQKGFEVEPAENNHGYDLAIKAKDKYSGNEYTLEVLKGTRPLYVLTVFERYAGKKHVITFENYTTGGIDIRNAEIYENGSNYAARRLESARLLKKYDMLACLVHGLITNGNATPEEPEETEAPQEDAAKVYRDMIDKYIDDLKKEYESAHELPTKVSNYEFIYGKLFGIYEITEKTLPLADHIALYEYRRTDRDIISKAFNEDYINTLYKVYRDSWAFSARKAASAI